MSMLITGIAELVTNDPETHRPVGPAQGETADVTALGIVRDAAVVIGADGPDAPTLVQWVGPADRAPTADWAIDLGGKAVVPGFVDAHSHLVFAGDRALEFAARMHGLPYDGGGIRSTVEATREAGELTLRRLLQARITELRAQGTTTVEIKSGYGLDVATEVLMLQVAKTFTQETTYLGAHVVPSEHADDRAAYVDLVCGEMLDACAPHARWVDVFCEPASPHAFTGEESRRILQAGMAKGLVPRVHGNQLADGPGVALAVELGAASVDHCTHVSDTDVEALAAAAETTTAILLPGAEFSTRSAYPSGRRLLDAGCSVAIATDCNPGTCNSTSMPFMIALAVREMGLTPAEALLAATKSAARSLHRTDVGVVQVGGRADLAVLDAPSYLHLAYRPGVPLARTLEV